ncbi:Tfp pilus assembly protein FimT/FimU [Sporolactobacillus kofuensis]|uniref:Tfp pilus assembly protein FimT/FimU n=1 Tax=Sporolactobacillus kofuensis TaxID=269672 RepID=A0ABW1WBK2_9BACL|nr:type II secretion system protein [Sporolactobacillus kofuensis]MCO7175622.1 type II secretion system protein [Sporolactobacillus kofuensis]
MITNSKGVTMVELLAVVVIATICLTLIFGIWLSGDQSAKRTMTENDLQADAHLVQVRITRAFYDQQDRPFSVNIDNGNVILTLTNSDSSTRDETISDPDLFYIKEEDADTQPQSILNGNNKEIGKKITVDYVIKMRNSSNEADIGGPSFHLDTTLNYPWTDDEESGSSDSQK